MKTTNDDWTYFDFKNVIELPYDIKNPSDINTTPTQDDLDLEKERMLDELYLTLTDKQKECLANFTEYRPLFKL